MRWPRSSASPSGPGSRQRALVGVFTSWGDYLPPLPPVAEIDLGKLRKDGNLTVDTNLTWTNAGQPTRGPLAAIDGVKTFFNSATLDRSGAAGSYTVRFARPQGVASIGVVLKPGSGTSGRSP